MGYINLKIKYKGEQEARQITNDLNETQLNALMGYVNSGYIKVDEIYIKENNR